MIQRGPIQPSRGGFSLVEVVCALGVLLVLLSVLWPRLVLARRSAADARDLANIRGLGIGLQGYAQDHRDLPPVIFEPRLGPPERPDELQERNVRGVRVRGGWFDSGWLFHLMLTPFPPWEALRTPGAPRSGAAVVIDGVRGPYYADYALTQTLYATPEYFTPEHQLGPSQWRVQTLSSVRYPSQKGLLAQTVLFGVPGWRPDPMAALPESVAGVPACCYQTPPSAVLWADHSASTERQSELRAGVANRWSSANLLQPVPEGSPGMPIYETLWGAWGRDR